MIRHLLIPLLFGLAPLGAAKVTPIPLEKRKAYVNLPGMCSTEPGDRWDRGMVTGNGVMGASVLGQPYREKVVFNHERLFRPILEERPLPPKIHEALPKVRKLMREGNSGAAFNHWREVMNANGHTGIINTPSYHPAYTMHLERKNGGDVSDYLRTVDFMTGEVEIRFRNAEGRWLNRTFVSRADDVIVQSYESPDGKPFSMDLQLVDQWQSRAKEMESIVVNYEPQWMTARAKYKLTKRGYEGATRVIHQGGEMKVTKNGIRCLNVKSLLLLTRIVDLDDFAHSEMVSTRQDLLSLSSSYPALLKPHVNKHGKAMSRMRITLDHSDDRYLSSEELIAKQWKSENIIPAFLEKMFNMGRYALLSSSGKYPPTLTGIWNGDQRPAWSGDWTLDTNINQQIASANTAALPEALEAYLNLIEEIAPTWEVNAQNLYGMRGYLAGFRTAGRENYHTHFYKFPGHCWTAGASWLIYPLYEYYQVTGDQDFLKNRVLPLMEKAALFYEDFLTEIDENGDYIFVPSHSPEHHSHSSMNAVQDIAASKQLLSNLIEAYQDLGIKKDRVAQLEKMLKKMPPYLVNDEGLFKEWAYPKYREGLGHRHMSHSYPIWPAHELNWEEHSEKIIAMRVALEKRLHQNWSGHAFGVRAFAAARTKYPQLYWLNLYYLMRYDLIERNLITRHNPGWCPNTDVLCGLPGMITEGLVYSKPGVLELLPSWSPKLPSGSIQGIRTRTQAIVDSLEWDVEAKQVSATITSMKDQWVQLFLRQGIQSISADTEVKPSGDKSMTREIFLKKGEPVRLTIKMAKPINSYPVNKPSFSQEIAERDYWEMKNGKK